MKHGFFAGILFIFGVTCAAAQDTDKQNFVPADFGVGYNGSVAWGREATYFFSGIVVGGVLPTVKVVSGVGEEVNQLMRFEVTWLEFIEQEPLVWSLPRLANSGNGSTTRYGQSNRTLCSTGVPGKLDTITIQVDIRTLSTDPVEYTILVLTNENNLVNQLNKDFEYSVNVTLFSPVYYKLQIDYDSHMSGFAMLEISSVDTMCVTVALEPENCPVLEDPDSVLLTRRLTMSGHASLTIKMSNLLQGRFLVFVVHENDSKCSAEACDGCWKNELLPMDITSGLRTKQLRFKLREKITNEQYLFASLLTTVFLGSLLVVFPVIYCACQTIKERRKEQQQNQRREENGDESPSTSDHCQLFWYQEELQCETYVCGFLVKRPNHCCEGTPPDARERSANRYFGTLLVNAIFYILPAVQLIWVYQRVFKVTGDEDLCYFNFRCLHPYYGLTAFNHVLSNVGYVALGIAFCVVVRFDRVGSKGAGIFQAMGIALVIQGVMSALYHTCPNQVSFQFDTSFMYVTAMLCWVHIYRAHNPDTAASAILTYALVAVAVALGVAAVLFRVWIFWVCIAGIQGFLCLVVSLHLDSLWGRYKWALVAPWRRTWNEVLQSFMIPFYRSSFSLRKIGLVMFNFINWLSAACGLWVFHKSQDFASYMLLLFIVNLFLFSSAYFYMKCQQRTVSLTSAAYLFLLVPIWGVAFVFYMKVNSTWALSPAESRNMNRDCVMFGFFDDHDVWHFLSAFGMFLNFMLFFTLEDGPKSGSRLGGRAAAQVACDEDEENCD